MSVLSQNEKRYFRNEIDRLPIFRYNRMGSQENEIVLFPICTTESTLLFEKMCICSQIVIKQCFGFFSYSCRRKNGWEYQRRIFMKLQNILFPSTDTCTEEPMYFRRGDKVFYNWSSDGVEIQKDGILFFDTYFNGFTIEKPYF